MPLISENDIIIEVLEIFINTVLYARNLYPQAIFRKRKVYGTTVPISIFPPLNDYIRNILLSVKDLKDNNQLECLELTFKRDNDITLEVHKFELDSTAKLLDFAKMHDDEYLIEFEQELRKTLLQLDGRLKNLRKLPMDTSFKIFLNTTQSGLVKLEHNVNLQDFPWITEKSGENPTGIKTIIPINYLKAGGVQYFVEEYL